jgi:hypothetical protein
MSFHLPVSLLIFTLLQEKRAKAGNPQAKQLSFRIQWKEKYFQIVSFQSSRPSRYILFAFLFLHDNAEMLLNFSWSRPPPHADVLNS